MKKFISLICSIALALNLVTLSAAAAGNSSLLVLGDSIATGFRLMGYVPGNNSSAKNSFANKLAPDFDVYNNFAVDGKTTAELLDDVKTDKALRKAAKKADHIVISIGGNDFLGPMIEAYKTSDSFSREQLDKIMDGSLTVAEALEQSWQKAYESTTEAAKNVDIKKSRSNIEQTVETLLALNKDTDIYILTVYNPFEGSSSMKEISDIAEELLTKLNKNIKSIAKKHDNVHVVDVSAAFKGHAAEYTNILTVDIHPSRKGHEVIYKKLVKSFESTTDFIHTEPPAEEKTDKYAASREELKKTFTDIAGMFGSNFKKS